ncbi:acyl-CoA carboxylase subunit epsilon [Actinokineospora sp. NBRC 105648]|uniref:acyl-CoA carboxylase subunit epsilon n=1 Tax=Actinokineospora sp. NBRC 105648 TaxID=3032206 RepID=UPI0024A133BE|nr:hypothetical protein Acsp05_02290 [Actinokineospora sp. NBRC 105648]
MTPPTIRVTKGNPTPEELAALLTVLLSPPAPAPAPTGRALWTDTGRTWASARSWQTP